MLAALMGLRGYIFTVDLWLWYLREVTFRERAWNRKVNLINEIFKMDCNIFMKMFIGKLIHKAMDLKIQLYTHSVLI